MTREKSTSIQIRVSPEEKQKIEAQRKIENFGSLSEFVRKVTLDRCNSLPLSKPTDQKQ